MGITIHYSGRFNPASSLENMIEEVEEIASIYNWPYHIFDRAFDEALLNKESYTENIYGICFTPPESETFFLTFLSNGRMSSIINLRLWGNSENEKEKEYLYMVASKTQYAGANVHKVVVQLLKYIERKYLLDLKIVDEGYYWDTGDEKLLEKTFKEYSGLIDAFANMLENTSANKGETTEDYLLRLAKYIHNKDKGKE